MSKNITLKPKEERKLLELAKKGLKLHNEEKKVPPRLLEAIRQIDYEDLVAEGTTSLLKAIEKFDLNSKSRFATYAGHWIRQYIQTFINKNQFINQSPVNKEKRNVIFYDGSYQNKDEQSNSYSLIDTLDDSENLKSDNDQVRQRDTAIQVNDLINSLKDREKILLIRLLHKIIPSNLLDIYHVAEKDEREELKKTIKIGRGKDLNTLKDCSLREKTFSNLPVVKKYLAMFSKEYKFSELTKLFDKSDENGKLNDQQIEEYLLKKRLNLKNYFVFNLQKEVKPGKVNLGGVLTNNGRGVVNEETCNWFANSAGIGGISYYEGCTLAVENQDNERFNPYKPTFREIYTISVSLKTSSNFLTGFQPNEDATVIKLLKKKGYTCMGKTGLDEFACGGSGLLSNKGTLVNPHNLQHIVGGSSSGSAVAVAQNLVLFALGSDTGGSIRCPAAYCGIVGFKPSYGLISRYGLIPFASSLDTVGILASQVETAKKIFLLLAKEDPRDLLTIAKKKRVKVLKSNKRIAIIQGLEKHLEKEFKELYHQTLNILKKEGELLSHLNALQGITFGIKENSSIFKKRNTFLGQEVKKRLLLGAYFLENLDMSGPAPKINEISSAFAGSQIIHWSDNLLLLANFSGVPSLSLPIGVVKGLPVSLNINSAYGNDQELLAMAGRELAADLQGAKIVGVDSMLKTLRKLLYLENKEWVVDGVDLTEDENIQQGEPNAVSLLKFNPEKKKRGLLDLFRTHPLLEDRIKRLEKLRKRKLGISNR
ncbi:875_t:CDS:2 [Ambispora leptoticha]|uniref:875_t:CDS:1 n=1 Tax=Ambispora leptoticha TaxID=144679 RepID=A0A9N8W439_9GLOM|nr:875_t:CDS:2 [Ambispora leptoticha]